jgi:hypothetical protein
MQKLMIVFLMAGLALSAFAGVLYVDNNMNDGFWVDSYHNLNEALQNAEAGDEIWVATGVYTPGTDRDDSFVLKAGVRIYGGFMGGETRFKYRDPHQYPTILSGEIGEEERYEDNIRHIVSYNGILDRETLLDGFVIRDAFADEGQGGGGLYLENGAEPLIRNCRFVNNRSSGNGGAAYVMNGPVFEQCLFETNSAGYGAAIYIHEDHKQEGIPDIRRCTFVRNIAEDGAAIYISKHESVHIDSTIFWENTDMSGTVRTLYLDNRGRGTTSLTNSAIDQESIDPVFVTENVTYYQTDEITGPFKNTDNYLIDKDSGIPQDYGWYYMPSPLVLNIRVFMEGPM